MKKISLLIVGVMLLSQNTFATKARLLALGEDKDGSYFINDNRNYFLNAAHINNHEDQVVYEWGNSAGDTAIFASSLDLDVTPKSMGGFTRSMGSYAYGVYLGNESDTLQLRRMSAWGAGTSATDTLASADNVLDVFFGGDSGIKWGVNFAYSKNKTEFDGSTQTNLKDHSYGSRFGVIMGSTELIANIALGNEAEDTRAGTADNETLKFEGKLGFQVAASHAFGNLRPFVSYKGGKWDIKSAAATQEAEFTIKEAGITYKRETGKGSHVYTKAFYYLEEIEVKYTAGAAKGKIKKIPLSVGFETAATSWLTLRGSVVHNLVGKRDTTNLANVPNTSAKNVYTARYNRTAGDTANRKETIGDSTSVNAGASLMFGKLSVDGMIGVNGNSGTRTASDSKTGVLDLDRLLTRVGMTYNF
jgi:hypothetical protein